MLSILKGALSTRRLPPPRAHNPRYAAVWAGIRRPRGGCVCVGTVRTMSQTSSIGASASGWRSLCGERWARGGLERSVTCSRSASHAGDLSVCDLCFAAVTGSETLPPLDGLPSWLSLVRAVGPGCLRARR